MILICAEAGEPVIWIDPRGRQFRRIELVPLVFGRVEEWQAMLTEADVPICVHVLRTKTEVLTLDRAKHLVLQRMRKLQARRRAQARSSSTDPQLEGM